MKNRVCEILGIEKPVIQAPMAWITSAEFVAAVSNAGGLGTLAPNAGQTTITPDPIETAERMRREIRKTRTLTDKPFAVNYILPVPCDGEDQYANIFSEPMLQVCIEEKIKILCCSGTVNEKEIKRLKELGFIVIFRDYVAPTVASAKSAEKAGVDIIVATGFEEGGSMPAIPVGTFTVTPMLADAINIPVVTAGGIVDSRTAKAAFVLGAEGLYVGTLMIASEENPASQICKDAIVNAESDDLVIFPTAPTFTRATPGTKVNQIKAILEAGGGREDIAEILDTMNSIKSGMLEGDMENSIVMVSSSLSMIHKVRPVKEIIDDLCSDLTF